MRKKKYNFKQEVWLYPGMSGWHFVSIPKKESSRIKKEYNNVSRGWGSIPVSVTSGKSVWKTSIFPLKKSDEYLMPIKAKIRKEEGIFKGDYINFSIEILL